MPLSCQLRSADLTSQEYTSEHPSENPLRTPFYEPLLRAACVATRPLSRRAPPNQKTRNCYVLNSENREENLVVQPRPPLSRYRVLPYLSHLRFSGIARYRAIPTQICPMAAEEMRWQGASQLKLPSGGYRAIRGYR